MAIGAAIACRVKRKRIIFQLGSPEADSRRFAKGGKCSESYFEMDLFVTRSAQGDQVLFRIVAEQAARLNMVHLEVCHTATILTAPAVAV